MSVWDELEIAETPDVRAIKRAYAAKLKRTRPDDDPAGFSRLRAAFEAAVQLAERRAAALAAVPAEPIDEPARPAPEAVRPAEADETPLDVVSQTTLSEIITLMNKREMIAAATAFQYAASKDVLPLETKMALGNHFLARLAGDPEIPGDALIEATKLMGWYGRDAFTRSSANPEMLRRLHGRIAAEEWFVGLERFRRKVVTPSAIAARLLLGRGSLPMWRRWLIGRFPPEPPLYGMLATYQNYAAWLSPRFDAGRLASLADVRWDRDITTKRKFIGQGLLAVILLAIFILSGAVTGSAYGLGMFWFVAVRRTTGFHYLSIMPLAVIAVIAAYFAAVSPEITQLIAPIDRPQPLHRAERPIVPADPGPTAKKDDQIRELQTRARSGDAVSAYQLGMRLLHGDGVTEDPGKGAYWLSVAAPNSAIATETLGYLYQTGRGVTQDLAKARDYYGRAGHDIPEAQFLLARLMRDGLGGSKDEVAAYQLDLQAARRGYLHSAVMVGRALFDGTGVAHDRIAARDWFNAAAEAGDPDGARLSGEIALEGKVGKPDFRAAYRWLALAVQNYPFGMAGSTQAQDLLQTAIHKVSPLDRGAVDAEIKVWKAQKFVPPA